MKKVKKHSSIKKLKIIMFVAILWVSIIGIKNVYADGDVAEIKVYNSNDTLTFNARYTSPTEAIYKLNDVLTSGNKVIFNVYSDIGVDARIIANDNTKLEINLNGHILRRAWAKHSDGEVIYLGENSELTINGGADDQAKSIAHTIWYDDDWDYDRDKSVVIHGGIITGGYTTSDGGGIKAEANSKIILNDVSISGNIARISNGGGITLDGPNIKLTMNNSSISYNIAGKYGGGIYVYGGIATDAEHCTVEMHNSHIDNNFADSGGGIFVDAEYFTLTGDANANYSLTKSEDAVNLTGSTISNNEAWTEDKTWFWRGGGGIFFNEDNATISGVNFVGNKSNEAGAISLDEENITLSNCNFIRNYSENSVSAIYVNNDNNTISDSVIMYNTSDGNNNITSAVYVDGLCDIKLSGKVYIKNNYAPNKPMFANLMLSMNSIFKSYIAGNPDTGSDIHVYPYYDTMNSTRDISSEPGDYDVKIYTSDYPEHFVGWDKNGDRILRLYKITDYSNTERAHLEGYYFVTYKDGSETLNTEKVYSGEKVTKPSDPTKDGYVFAGWYKDSLFKELFNFGETTITGDTTIYAKWDIAIESASATVTTPVAGEHPSFTAIVPDGAHYTATVYYWADTDAGQEITASDTFVTGTNYQVRIHFTADAGYEFSNPADFTINEVPNFIACDTYLHRAMNFVVTAPAHTHELTLVPATSATCSATGNNAYYACSGCTKVFKDALGTVETTVEAETLPIDTNAHDWNDWVETTPATETTPGEETRTCNHNPEHTETQPIPPLAHIHALTEVPAKSATCSATGNNAYYTCSGCTKVFKDALGTVETTVEAETIAIDTNAHDWGDWVETTPATVDAEGTKTRTCKHDASHIETDTIEKLALEITDGGNKTYKIDSGEEVKIKCNGTLANFTKLTSNETDVDSSNYIKESGSTVITLKNDYLDSLSEGTYKLAFVYNDGRKAETNLTIVAESTTPADTTGDDTQGDDTSSESPTTTPSDTTTTEGTTKTSNSPKTGDNIVVYIALMLISIIGVFGTIKFNKKKD